MALYGAQPSSLTEAAAAALHLKNPRCVHSTYMGKKALVLGGPGITLTADTLRTPGSRVPAAAAAASWRRVNCT